MRNLHFFLCCAILLGCHPAPEDSSPPLTDTQQDTDDPSTCDPAGDHIDVSQLIQAQDWIATERNFIDSFQVQHCGQDIVTGYYNDYDAETLHELQSATKTYSAMLVGIAIDHGHIAGVWQPLSELLPDHAHLLTGEKADITLEHALTMTTGLRWVDFGVDNSFDRIDQASDSVEFILSEPLDSSPGQTFFYNTGSSHLLSAIVQATTGMSAADYAEQQLFGPLGIQCYTWPALDDGVNQGGWGMEMLPADFAKLGQLMLDEGVWDGERVVSQAFIDAATAPQVDNGYGGSYGYQMWIETNLFDEDDLAAARGYGGQDCFVLEELDMVATFTGDIMHPAEMAEDVASIMNSWVFPSHVGDRH